MIDDCIIRSMNKTDLEPVLAWRNHPEIRRYMLSQHKISLDEHRHWFELTSQDSKRRLLIVEHTEIPIGFVHFNGVAPDGVADWGFYTVPDAPKGSGKKLGLMALNFAFQTLMLHKVCGQALGFNEPSIRFHRMLGFQQEGVLRDQHKIGAAYHNLIHFGLLRHEWALNNGG